MTHNAYGLASVAAVAAVVGGLAFASVVHADGDNHGNAKCVGNADHEGNQNDKGTSKAGDVDVSECTTSSTSTTSPTPTATPSAGDPAASSSIAASTSVSISSGSPILPSLSSSPPSVPGTGVDLPLTAIVLVGAGGSILGGSLVRRR